LNTLTGARILLSEDANEESRMTSETIGARFRALHEGDAAFVIPNPWDVGAAKIMEGLGFKALATTSAGFAASLGKADGGASLEEAMTHCRALVEAVDIPLSADLEKGYGDAPEDVARTVKAAAEVGLAGCSIEDYSGEAIYDFGLAVERAVAAVEAARGLDRDFVLTVRAENLIRGRDDLNDTIKRLQAYEVAGADVLYAPGLKDIGMVRAVTGAVSKPVNVLIGQTTDMTASQLSEAGVKRISVGAALTWAAYGEMIAVARRMLEEGRFDYGGSPGHGAIRTLIQR
jgi:2-methylisocitrate lyase-like PEP mutase family enzyme